ncbi:MAG: hypothetical protein AAGF11_30480 [Myxococcota bacterium]
MSHNAECGKPRALLGRFVILAAPRTGSNMLCTIVGAHPDIVCHHELFNPRGIFTALEYRDCELGWGTMAQRDRDPADFLQKVFATPLGHEIVGLKTTLYQNRRALDVLIADPTVHKIVLRRRNRVRTFVSTRIAEQLDEWEVYDRSALARERPRVVVEVDELFRYVEQMDAYYADVCGQIHAHGQTPLETTYERLCRAEEQARIFAFLGARAVSLPITPRSVRQNDRSLHDLVANLGELTHALAGHALHADLVEPSSGIRSE